jgi:hypothetical protein
MITPVFDNFSCIVYSYIKFKHIQYSLNWQVIYMWSLYLKALFSWYLPMIKLRTLWYRSDCKALIFLPGKLNSIGEGSGIMSSLLTKKSTERNDHFVDVTAYMQVFSDTGQVVPIEVHQYTAFLTINLSRNMNKAHTLCSVSRALRFVRFEIWARQSCLTLQFS